MPHDKIMNRREFIQKVGAMEVLAVITLGFGVVPLEGLSATAQVGRKKDLHP